MRDICTRSRPLSVERIDMNKAAEKVFFIQYLLSLLSNGLRASIKQVFAQFDTSLTLARNQSKQAINHPYDQCCDQLLSLLSRIVQSSDVNGMTSERLSLIFAPYFLRPAQPVRATHTLHTRLVSLPQTHAHGANSCIIWRATTRRWCFSCAP